MLRSSERNATGRDRAALRERLRDVAAVIGVIGVWLLVWVLVPIGAPPPGIALP